MTGGALPEPVHIDMNFVYAARLPSRLHNRMDAPGMSSTVVADGESLMAWLPELNQYFVQRAPQVGPGESPEGQLGAAIYPLQTLATLAQGLESVEDAGADTVRTGSGPVRCRRLSLTYPRDTTGGPIFRPRMLWVDESRRLVLRDSITIDFDTPQAGHVQRTQDMRFVRLDPGRGGPDSFYVFAAPAGAHRVERFGAAEPPKSKLVGKAAHDFTLPALAGPEVSLANLKGHVVVLDFWATWCGPCRRWMPIVAKMEQEMKGRDVRFFAVNVAESPEQVRKYLRLAGTTPTVLLDRDGKTSEAYGAASIPLTVVIGKDGVVAQVLIGLHPEEDLRSALASAGIH
jgi:thiol-disulfide isomerase/thioredoxin